jgi:hypothetical protein
MAQGIFNAEHHTTYRKAVANRVLLAGDTASAEVLLAARTGHTIYVNLIVCSVTTTAAQSLDFQDSAGTPLEVGALIISATEGAHRIDFGDEGVPLTEGTALTFTTSAAGIAAYIHVEGYYKQTAVMSQAALASA